MATKRRKYTPAEIDSINKAAPKKIDAVNEDSMNQTKGKLLKAKQKMDRNTWNREYQRKLT